MMLNYANPTLVAAQKAAKAVVTAAISLLYHIGDGWFGGLLPTSAFATMAATGDIFYGLWYPVIVATGTFVIGMIFVKETKGVNIYARD